MKSVTQRVHLQQRRGLGRVAEVVTQFALGQRRTGGRLDGARSGIARGRADVLGTKRESQPGQIAAATGAGEDDVRPFAGQCHLLERFLADHGLVQADVVEHAAQAE